MNMCTTEFTASAFVVAPNNANAFGITPQQKKACLDQWANSAAGKTAQFFSLYNLATNLKNVWKEWTLLPAGKMGAMWALGKASSAMGGTEISSVVTGATTTVTAAPVASGVAAAESVGGAVAPYGMAAATIVDMNVSAGCAGMPAPPPEAFHF